MKKVLGIFLALTLIFTLGTISAFAGHGRGHGGGHGSGHGHRTDISSCTFVDENKDGICDIHSTDCHFTDENQDGNCDNHRSGTCRRR